MIIELTDLFEQLIDACSWYSPNSNKNLIIADDTDYNIKINYFNYTILFFKMETDLNFKFCYDIGGYDSSAFASITTSDICLSRYVDQEHYTNFYSADMILLFLYDHETKGIHDSIGNKEFLNLFIEHNISNIYDIDIDTELYFKMKGFW